MFFTSIKNNTINLSPAVIDCLNPLYAGFAGSLGSPESVLVAPAVAALRSASADEPGPGAAFGADTGFVAGHAIAAVPAGVRAEGDAQSAIGYAHESNVQAGGAQDRSGM